MFWIGCQHTYRLNEYTDEDHAVNANRKNLKRKNYYLDENKIHRAKVILGARTETEAIEGALDLVVFRREILESLEKVAGKGGVEKVF